MTRQPEWKFIANLDDNHPLDYGGLFVFEDTTGVYAPECELLLEPPGDSGGDYTIYRWCMEPCTFINGVLSDNKYHPDKEAWFAKSLPVIADYCGQELETIIQGLVGGDVREKALIWSVIGGYHGYENLDSYPIYMAREEVAERIKNWK